MSQDDKLQAKLNSLKQAYEQMQPISNAERLANRLIERNGKAVNKRFRFFPIGAAVTVFILVGLLIITTPDLFHSSSEHSAESLKESADVQLKQEDNKPTEPNENQIDNNHTVEINRPESKTEMLEIEGMPEEKTYTLVKNENIGVSTYYPEDMIAETKQNRIKIFANFGGEKNEHAFFEIYKASVSQSIDGGIDLGQLLSDFDSYTITEQPKETYSIPFSKKEFAIEKEHYTGKVSIFTKKDNLFRITIHYPVEMGDGFGPRVAKIIEELEFHD